MSLFAAFAVFRDLPVGARFRFLYNPYFNPRTSQQVYMKIHARWFTDERGRKYATSATTAVREEAA